MFQLSLTLTAFMILTALIPFSVRSRWLCLLPCLAWVLIWGFVILVEQIVCFPPAIGWVYLFVIIAFPIVRWMKLNWILFQAVCLCCTLFAYGISLVEFLPAYREHRELLAKYPAVDLAPRLAYEHRALNAIQATSDGGADVLTSVVASPKYNAESLNQLDEAFRRYLDLSILHVERRRTDRRFAFQSLMRAHEGFVADFIAQPGVGRSRIPGLKLLRKSNFIDVWDGVRLDVPAELIEQPDQQKQFSDSTDNALSAEQTERNSLGQPDPMIRQPYVPIPDRQNLQWLHHHNITNFVPPNSLGGVDDQLQARGFDAHAFRLSPTKTEWENSPKDWRLARLELVSLLKHRPPAVYVSTHLPAMDELRDAPTRAVTTFESEAIAKLSRGEDLVVEKCGNHELSMVGSIRAISDCRQCHRVPLGSLLGAFSYKLKAVSAMPGKSVE